LLNLVGWGRAWLNSVRLLGGGSRNAIASQGFTQVLQTLLGSFIKYIHELRVPSNDWDVLLQSQQCSRILRESVVASNDVLKEARNGLVLLTRNHVVENSAYCEEPLCCLTQVVQSLLIQEDLLDYKRGHSLRKISASFHDPKTKGNNFSLK